MKRNFKIELDITVYLSDAPDGTPDVEVLQEELISANFDWIAGMISRQCDIIAELKNAEVGDFVYMPTE